jgi:hypothetical protein
MLKWRYTILTSVFIILSFIYLGNAGDIILEVFNRVTFHIAVFWILTHCSF